jgi:hypothetical protein
VSTSTSAAAARSARRAMRCGRDEMSVVKRCAAGVARQASRRTILVSLPDGVDVRMSSA